MGKDLKAMEFVPCSETWREGYIIPVRCRLNNMLEKEFLPEKLKEKYLEDWGHDIIYDDEFIDWYSKLVG